jgi:ubiquinone/menaquinone biosynthesis C-methylase UbiE
MAYDERTAERVRQQAVRHAYTGLARRYDRRWAVYVEATVAATLRRMELAQGESVLDVGCGTGVLLHELRRLDPAVRVTGIDLAPAMLSLAAGKLCSKALLAVADAAALPFPAASFDLVVSTSSLHYWPDPVAGLREMARVVRPQGHVVVTDWCDDYLACWICDRVLRLAGRAHRRAYGREECRRFLLQAGLQVGTIHRYKIDWLWGLMTARAHRRSGAPFGGCQAP